MNLESQTNQAIQAEIGRRLQQERLNRNLTQTQLTQRAGISRRTLVAAEADGSMTFGTFVAILRELALLPRLDALLPEPAVSPVEMVRMRGAKRRRASSPRRRAAPASASDANENILREPTPWKWKE